ncbi:MAG: beta-ketoacyl-ACP synthase III [bacterium]
MIYARIAGTGSYLPEKILSNNDLEKIVETSDQWIQERTGIKQRHIAADGETTGMLATIACERALQAAKVKASEIDLIVLGTTTPDLAFPSTACTVQANLGCSGAAFDVNAACTGFIFALSIAEQYIKTGAAKKVLVSGAETFSRILDWTDRTTCVLFGDGAGAVLLEASDEPGIITSHIHSDGSYADLLHTKTGISVGLEPVEGGGVKVQMRGNEVFKVAVKTLGRIVDETLSHSGLEKSEIDWLIPHQANMRIIKATAKKLNLPLEQVITTVAEHGNTSAASVPLALDYAIKNNKIQRGEKLLLEAFGGGFTWGSALIQY